MKTTFLFLAKLWSYLLLVMVTPLLATTPTINGTVNSGEYGSHSDGDNKQGDVYMTWDDNNLYVAFTNSNTTEAGVFYLDKNPVTPVNGGSNSDGTLIGFNYDGTNFTALPFRADFVCYFKDTYREFRTADGANGWSSPTLAFGSYANSGGNSRELAIPWSLLGGKPASFNFYTYITSSGGFVYNQVPTENGSGSIGTSARYERYYTISSTDNITGTLPFSQNSYCFNRTTDATGFGAITVYDFTMNSSGFSIMRGTGNWVINGNLVAGNGTIDFGSTTSTAVVKNVNITNGNLTLSAASGGDLSVEGDFMRTIGTFTPQSRRVTFSGGNDQIISGASTFFNLEVNKTAGKVILNNDVTVTNTLTFTSNHNIETGSNTLSVTNNASGAVDYSGGGHVVGDLERKITVGTTYAFPSGDGTTDALAAVTVNSGTFGANPVITVFSTDGKHPLNNATTNFLTRSWTVEASDVTAIDYNITFTYDDSDFTGSDETQIKLWKTVSGVWTEQTTVVDPGANTLTVAGLTSFSEFTGAPAGAGSFPVEWQSFTATPVGSAVQLDWTTASEQNADRFVIERSADGTAFAAIGEQVAAGNSTTLQQYQFVDDSPLTGTSYYRLRQLDMDGSVHFSATVEVAFTPTQTSLRLAPNPVAAGQQLTRLGGRGEAANLSLYTPAGQEVVQLYFGAAIHTVSLPVLPAGLYLYRLSENGQQVYGRLQVQ